MPLGGNHVQSVLQGSDHGSQILPGRLFRPRKIQQQAAALDPGHSPGQHSPGGVTFSPSIHMATGMAGISRSSTARDICAKNTFPWDVQKTGNREPISDTMRKPSRLSTWSRVMTLPPS